MLQNLATSTKPQTNINQNIARGNQASYGLQVNRGVWNSPVLCACYRLVLEVPNAESLAKLVDPELDYRDHDYFQFCSYASHCTVQQQKYICKMAWKKTSFLVHHLKCFFRESRSYQTHISLSGCCLPCGPPWQVGRWDAGYIKETLRTKWAWENYSEIHLSTTILLPPQVFFPEPPSAGLDLILPMF
jgi:hypothetical protein